LCNGWQGQQGQQGGKQAEVPHRVEERRGGSIRAWMVRR
jgi:hypothetical protein